MSPGCTQSANGNGCAGIDLNPSTNEQITLARGDKRGLRGYLKYIYVDGANMYYLNDTRKIASLRDGAEAFRRAGMIAAAEEDHKKAEQLAAVAKDAADNGITVINCNIVNCFDI